MTATQPNPNYVKNMTFGKHGMIAKTTGSPAASNKYYCDYFYKGAGFAHVGGNANTGLGSGVCVYLSDAVGNSYWALAAALSCKPLAEEGVNSP